MSCSFRWPKWFQTLLLITKWCVCVSAVELGGSVRYFALRLSLAFLALAVCLVSSVKRGGAFSLVALWNGTHSMPLCCCGSLFLNMCQETRGERDWLLGIYLVVMLRVTDLLCVCVWLYRYNCQKLLFLPHLNVILVKNIYIYKNKPWSLKLMKLKKKIFDRAIR